MLLALDLRGYTAADFDGVAVRVTLNASGPPGGLSPAVIAAVRTVVIATALDGSVLPSHAELVAPNDSSAMVWVRVTEQVATEGAFFLYMGGSTGLDRQATAVFPECTAVFHLADLTDATGIHPPLAPFLTGGGQPPVLDTTTGVANFTGNAGLAIAGALDDAAGASAITLLAQATVPEPDQTDVLVGFERASGGGSRVTIEAVANGARLLVRAPDSDSPYQLDSTTELGGACLHGVVDLAAQQARLFYDGALVASLDLLNAAPALSPASSEAAAIGADEQRTSGFLEGEIAEVRACRYAPSATRVAIEALTLRDALASVVAVEP